MEHAISFPALGLDFNINRVAVNLFGKDIYWYGIIICLGFVLLTYRLLKQGDLPLALAVPLFALVYFALSLPFAWLVNRIPAVGPKLT